MDVLADLTVIRRAREADLPEVMLLERETPTAPHWAMAEYLGMVGAGTGGRLRRALFVATEGQKIRGFSVGSVVGSGREAEAELESVAVRRSDRRQGLGSALCRAVMQWSRDEGAHVITLEVRVGSSGAVRLYGGLGFVSAGRRSRYYQDPQEDAAVMRCELGGTTRAATNEEPWLKFEEG